MDEIDRTNIGYIWLVVMLISIGAIITSILFIYFEIKEAKKECENIDGVYKISRHFTNLCNGREFVKFHYCYGIGEQRICKTEWNYEDFENDILKFLENISETETNETKINFSKFDYLIP